MDSKQTTVTFSDSLDLRALCGEHDANLRTIEEMAHVTLALREDAIEVDGLAQDVLFAARLLGSLIQIVEDGSALSTDDVHAAARVLRTSELSPDFLQKDVLLTYRGRAIRPKTSGQKRYCDAIRSNTITFGIGPAGTGKTYLAMALAVSALKRKEVGRIVLTRPVVEAGENLGFLPGTLTEKVDPYMRPLYDALFDMTDREKGNQLLEQGVIEIAPLAFMRGRTFNDAFLILDEAQNTTPAQMKMFLTRLGFGSKMVITGDAMQTDLAHHFTGLDDVYTVLQGIDDIVFVHFSRDDVVRHSLVAQIVEAYAHAGRDGHDKDGSLQGKGLQNESLH